MLYKTLDIQKFRRCYSVIDHVNSTNKGCLGKVIRVDTEETFITRAPSY